jgi:hypothetical protein
MLELMQQGQTNSSFAWEIEIHNSWSVDLFTKRSQLWTKNATLEQTCWIGATWWYHCIADDSGIVKNERNRLSTLKKHLFPNHPQTQSNYLAWIVNPQAQLLKICPFLRHIC